MTFCPGPTSIMAEAKVFSLNTKKTTRKPSATRISPATANIRRHRRPGKTMIDCGEHQHRDKCDQCEDLNDPLAPILLGAGARIHPPLQQLRIVLRKVERDRER